jgi:glycosyltransferase involved in cell wall biosynthesis
VKPTKKRVLLIIPNLDFGGAQNSFARLSEILDPFCELMLVVFNKDNMAPLKLYGTLANLEVNASNGYAGKLINFCRRVVRLRKIKREFNPDFSISFLEGADYVNILSSNGEKLLLYMHGSKLFDRNIRGLMGSIRKKILVPFFYRYADQILVVNDRLRVELVDHFKVKGLGYKVMPNFYDVDHFNAMAGEPVPGFLEHIFQNHPTACISGRIAPEKGIDRFVRILPRILQDVRDLRILIVGDGPDKELIVRECAKAGISCADIEVANDATVLFTGYQKNPYRFLARSTMLLLPSLNEGMPNTVVEAMCLGVPVVAADCPYGPRELLSEKATKEDHVWPEFAAYGILAPVLHGESNEPSYWGEAIAKIARDLSLRKHYIASGKKRSLIFSKEDNIRLWRELVGGNYH